jgi:hypothetical protein
MPLSKDPLKGGTNSDGSKSLKYCSLCFNDGNFTSPEIDTAQKMQAFAKEKLKEMRIPGFVARVLTLEIPKLERWKNKNEA